jgi:two-component system sensor histidine kinase/response regulator
MHLLGSTLRERRETAETSSRSVESQAGIRGASILLVEDNDFNQDVATEILGSAGCTVALAADGAEAVRKVQEADYDLVLMDVQMPVMDGMTATREIRKQPRFAALPIIAMTANAMKEDREQCIAAGMNDYIMKPIDPDAMFAVLRKYYAMGTRDPASSLATALQSEGVEIPAIPGIDTEGGLRRVLGNKNLYLDLLRRYSEGQRDAASRVREALAGGDAIVAERLAHTLKGVSGNIGIVEAQAVAGELEAAIGGKQPDATISELLERLSSIVATAIGRIDSVLTETAKSKPASSNENRVTHSLAEMVDKLRRYAEESDSQALDYFASVREELATSCDRESFEKLDASLRAYDFSTALEVLKPLAGIAATSAAGANNGDIC